MKNLKKIATIFLAMALLALLVPVPAQCAASTSEGQAAVQAVNAFALDLSRHFRKKEGNLVFSPYSISICLAMTHSGARGRTETQMAKVLRLSFQQPKIGEEFALINAQVLAAGHGKTAEINIASALWAEKSYPLQQEFTEYVRINYQGALRQLDFQRSPATARKTINGWVEAETKEKIKDLLAPGKITEDTRLVVTNAVYFRGKWESEFRKALTKEASFILVDGKEVRVPLMHQTAAFGYAEDPELQVLEMPYKGGELSMVILLPTKQKRFDDFEQSITLDKLSRWVGSLKPREVSVFLPKFKMTSEPELKTALMALGMTDAFSRANADFSGMTGHKDLFIDAAVHKAFLEVNEEGTEAAAATAIPFGPTMALKRDPIPVFRADHPFLFLIRHKPTNCTLFSGRVTKP